MKSQSIRAIISTLLIILLLCLAFTGALLHFGKTGVVLGIPRSVLRGIHFWVAVSLCVLALVHLILNIKQYKAELRSLSGVNIGEGDVREGRR